jgi:hypothetical protein
MAKRFIHAPGCGHSPAATRKSKRRMAGHVNKLWQYRELRRSSAPRRRPESMDITQDDPPPPEDPVRIAGQAFIRTRWAYLMTRTRASLRRSGFYADNGKPLSPTDGGHGPYEDVERLEISLGRLQQCATARLPAREDVGAVIPPEALAQEVQPACDAVLFVPEWRDPEFLRLALRATQNHCLAKTLTVAGPARRTGAAARAGRFVRLALVTISPAAAAAALVSALQADLLVSTSAMYLVGAAALAARELARGDEKEKPTEAERNYFAWARYQQDRSPAALGEGDRVRLEQMAAAGVPVPLMAFDLCAALQVEASRPLDEPPRR